jgi:hypothetical protein
MIVKAQPGERCPMEGKPREYITADKPVEVPDDSIFYRRLVDDGSLVVCGDDRPAPPAKDKGGAV